jgi:hypothetical protein
LEARTAGQQQSCRTRGLARRLGQLANIRAVRPRGWLVG